MSDQQGSGKYVCVTCLEDEALQWFAKERGQMRKCDYCDSTPPNPSVASLDDVTDFMRKAVSQEWCDPVQTAPYCSAEGGYQVETIDGYELFDVIGFEVSNEKLMSDILKAFQDHAWCEVNWQILQPSKRWTYGWERFQHVVKHLRRYTFWYYRDDLEDVSHPDYLPPADMLGEIETGINNAKLFTAIPAGRTFWRARLHAVDEVLSAPTSFTSPPVECAKQPNRMSPAGVPMFYCADDLDTSILELVDPDKPPSQQWAVSSVQFKNIITLNLLDLTSIPSPPSYFSVDGPFRRHLIRFLKKFVADLSQPIKGDERQHIEYVPTQVFTEFVRHMMKGPDGVSIHGIRYSSSRNGKACCVIFATQAECLPTHGPLDFTSQILEFVPGSMRSAEIARNGQIPN